MANAPITTTTEIAQPINVIFQRNLLERAKPLLPYFKGTKPGMIMENAGSFTIKWRRYEQQALATTPLTPLTGNVALPTRVSSQPSITDVTAVLQKFGDSFILNEEVDLINWDNQTAELSDVLGEQAGRSLNALQRNEEEDNSTAVLAGGAAAVVNINSKITLNDVRNTANQIIRNDALRFSAMTNGDENFNTTPILPAFWGITHPDVSADLRQIPTFKSVEQYSGQTRTISGEIGILEQVRFIETTDASIDAEAGATSAAVDGLRTSGNDKVDVYNTVIYGQNAFGSVGLDTNHIQEVYRSGDQVPAIMVVNHPRGSSGIADQLNELSSLGWKTWHAASVLNATWSRNLKSGAANLAA